MDKVKEQRIQNLLGMAQRARKVVSGAFAVEQAIKDGTAKLLLLAGDAEAKSVNAYKELAEKNRIPCVTVLHKDSMGECMGKEYRAVAALLDDGFSKSLRKLLGNIEKKDK